MRSTMEIARG